MKTLIPTLLFLALLSSACKKSDYADIQSGDQFKVLASDQQAAFIKAPVLGINAFTVNGNVFKVSAIGRNYGLLNQTWFSSEQGATLFCTTKFPFPATDGTFTFRLNNDMEKSMNMKVTVIMVDKGETYDMFQASEGVATLQVARGRFALNIPEVQLDVKDGSGSFIKVSGSLSSVSSGQGPVVDGPISNAHSNSGTNTDSDPKF